MASMNTSNRNIPPVSIVFVGLPFQCPPERPDGAGKLQASDGLCKGQVFFVHQAGCRIDLLAGQFAIWMPLTTSSARQIHEGFLFATP
jgi:hypothetical protein